MGFGPGSISLHGVPFPQPCLSAPAWDLRRSHDSVWLTPVEHPFMCASVTPNLESNSSLGPPCLGQHLHFSHGGQKGPLQSAQPGTQGVISVVPALRFPAQRPLLWTAAIARRRMKCKAECSVPSSVSVGLRLAPSHPALSSGEEGRGLESTEPFPRLCRLRTAFSFAHVLVCRGDGVLVSTQTRGLQACSHSSRRGLQPREAFPTLEAPLPLFLCPQPGFSLSMVCLLH